MADPVSIVGLSIAIFDQIIKLGERTSQLISDFKDSDEDSKRLHRDIVGENNRNALLKRLLFNSSPIYGGSSIFGQFPEDVQEEIKLDLVEIETVIAESVKLLERYGSLSTNIVTSASGTSSASGSSTSLASSSARNSFLTASKTHLQHFRWSVKGKKRVQEVLGHFAKLNGRIHGKIKLCSFASSIGVDPRHLDRLQNDPVAVQLGFHQDASLKLMAENARQQSSSLKLSKADSIDKTRDVVKIEERFEVAKWEQFAQTKAETVNILLEYRNYEPDPSDPNSLDDRTAGRIESLTKLLEQPKELVFRIPHCLWWTYSEREVILAFKIPDDRGQNAISLQFLLSKDLKLSLNNKANLALGLSRCLANLQMVKWVHESIRSENILFWSFKPSTTKEEDLATDLNFSQPWVLGFEHSRPEAGFSCALTDVCWERDIYRHPDRQGRPEKSFHKLHDIYALGVLLLEIGLWNAAQDIARSGRIGISDPANPTKRIYKVSETQAYFQKQAGRRLESYMGQKYTQVVLTCLSGDFGVQDDTREELRLQQAFRTQVVDVLEQLVNSI